MSNDPALVVGATGLLGGTVCSSLALERPTRALVRPTSRTKAEHLVKRGVEIAPGDLKESATLVSACRGIHTVISTATAIVSQNPTDAIETVDLAGQLSLIEAAEAAGVKRFIFLSFPEQPEDFPLQTAKRAIEQRLRRSRLGFTILRPCFFQDVWLSAPLGFDFLQRRARIYGSGERGQCWVSVADVAATVVSAAADASAVGHTYEFGGPEVLSPREAVKIFEEVSGEEFLLEFVPEEALRAQYSAATDSRERSFFALAIDYSRGRSAFTGTPNHWPSHKVRVRDYAKSVLGLE